MSAEPPTEPDDPDDQPAWDEPDEWTEAEPAATADEEDDALLDDVNFEVDLSFLKEYDLGIVGSLAGSVALVGLLALTAWLTSGPLAAGAFVIGGGAAAGLPIFAMFVLKDSLPGSSLISTISAMLAQLTFGNSAIVRTDTGDYQWRALRDADDGYRVVLEDGSVVQIDADDGDLDRWAMGKIALTEQKTERNMRRWQADESNAQTRAGHDIPAPTKTEPGSWLVSLANVQTATRMSGTSDIVRRGREKALEEHGGENQVSTLMTMMLSTVLLIVGFLLGWAALTL